jgi:SAM-dependent methyltransferase
MPAPPTAAQIREVNVRYHDAAADEYDGKWGIDFGPTGQNQVLGKLEKALGRDELPVFDRGMEIGAGTGYFTLNLMLAGVLREAVCTDISPGMLAALRANAKRLGLAVETVAGDAERLALPDASFDLVFGHAVLHHLPDLERAFGQFRRALRPGGTLAFAGEPSRYGDRLAALPKRGALTVAPLWRRAIGADPATPGGNGTSGNGRRDGGDHGVEFFVDVHAFSPADLRHFALGAGFEDAHVAGEELLASWFGWVNRTLEGTAVPEDVPWIWRQYAYRGYLLLQQVDRRLLEGRLPPEAFYNLMLAAGRPV